MRLEVNEPESKLQFQPSDVFEMAFAGSQVARWLISNDMGICLVCGHEGADMGKAEAHRPICPVRRWWEAVDALKVHLEVR